MVQQTRTFLALLLVLSCLSGCGMLDKKVHEGVEQAGQELGVDVRLDGVRIRIFGGSGQVTGLYIGNPPGYVAENAFEMQVIGLDLKLLSVLSSPVKLSNIVIDSPIVNLELKDPNGSNLKDIADTVSAKLNEQSPEEENADEEEESAGDSEKGEKDPIRIAIQNLRIEGVTFTIRRADGTTGSGTLPTIELRDVGGEEGVTMAGLAGTIAIALAGEILAQTVEERIANGELDPEQLVARLEERFAEFEDEIPDEMRPAVEDAMAELRRIIDGAEGDDYANLDAVAAQLGAAAAALAARLADALDEEQMARLRSQLTSIDADAIIALRDQLIVRVQQRLLLSDEQLANARPAIERGLLSLSDLQQALQSQELDATQFEARYQEISGSLGGQLRQFLDDSQYQSLLQWIDKAEDQLRKKYFPT